MVFKTTSYIYFIYYQNNVCTEEGIKNNKFPGSEASGIVDVRFGWCLIDGFIWLMKQKESEG